MHVLAVDLLGSGDSDSPQGADLSLEGHARSVRELLEHLGVERFAVVGHGHGGGVAQLLALGGGADAIVLIDSVAFEAWPAAPTRELRDRGVELDPDAVAAWLRDMLDRGMSRRELLSKTRRPGSSRKPLPGPFAHSWPNSRPVHKSHLGPDHCRERRMGPGTCRWGDVVDPLIRNHLAPLLVGKDCFAIEFINDVLWRATPAHRPHRAHDDRA